MLYEHPQCDSAIDSEDSPAPWVIATVFKKKPKGITLDPRAIESST